MFRHATVTVLLCLVTALVAAAPAAAAPSQALYFDAPNELRFTETRGPALDELQSLGVRALRVVLYWKDVAPAPDARERPSFDATDPAAYDWKHYDAVIAAAGERGWSVLLTPSGPVPRWATRGARDTVTRPSASEFRQFMTALGRRYGAQVRTWSVWNEPNHPDFLKPQYAKGKRVVSGPIYRALVKAADQGLEASGNGGDTLLFGETAPRGTGKVAAPLSFLRATLCLSTSYRKAKRCGRLDVDGFAHHPYTTRVGPFFRPSGQNDVTIGVLSRLTRALDRAGRAGAIRRRMPVWLTEFGVQSTPDRYLGVSLARQAEFRAIGERLAYGNRRVKAFSQYLLRDDRPLDGVPASARYGGFESGLRFATGKAKPSLASFKLTLTALRSGRSSRVSLWGLVRPATGRVRAEILAQDRGSRRFRRIRTVRTNARGVFSLRTAYREGRRYRLRFDGQQSHPVRVYRRP